MQITKWYSILLLIAAFVGIGMIQPMQAQVSSQQNVPRKFEDTLFKRIYVVTRKTKLDKYYQRADIKEWYKNRVQPPPLDMAVDLKKLSDNDLWFLKYELFARNGFLFDDPILRAHFKKFPWYQPIWEEPNFCIELTQQEYDFLKTVMAEEKSRDKEVYTADKSARIYKYSSVVNKTQFVKIPDQLAAALQARNFAIVPSNDAQLYYTYDKNAYDYTPNFITTDAYLQCMHVFLTGMMSHIEEEKICPLLFDLLKGMAKEASTVRKSSTRETVRSAANWVQTYAEIGLSLLEDAKHTVMPEMQGYLDHEFEQCKSGINDTSAFLRTKKISYMQFIPRGNYSRTRQMQSYFRAMKWLLSAPMYIDSSTSFSHALLFASILSHSDKGWKTYSQINKCMEFLVGKENNLSLNHLVSILQHDYAKAEFADLLRADIVQDISGKLLSMDPKQYNRANDKVHVFFFAGRYTVDNDIFSRVVNQDSAVGVREYPQGLDVLSALGNSEAEKLLKDKKIEPTKWKFYPDSLRLVKNLFSDKKNWSEGIFERIMKSLLELQKPDKSWPAFMKNEAWSRKNLSTALGAWAELRHDMLLYVESAASECGDGDDGPPPPLQQSYVEPNVAFWQEAGEVLKFEEKTLTDLGLVTEKIKNINKRLIDLAELLKSVSKKELANIFVPEPDMVYLHNIGGQFEAAINEIQASENAYGTDTDMAVIADVFVNKKGFLEAGVGHADHIYTIVAINGALYIAKGSVFSYYEFFSPGLVWTDEAWRSSIEKADDERRPAWMRDLLLHVPPLEVSPDYQF